MLEVTPAEIELLFEALDAWERVPTQEAFTSSMFSAMFEKNRESQELALAQAVAKGKQDELRRKRRSIMLKAKLVQSLEQESADSLFNVIKS